MIFKVFAADYNLFSNPFAMVFLWRKPLIFQTLMI